MMLMKVSSYIEVQCMSRREKVKLLTGAGAAINVKILSLKNRLTEYSDVQFIRILSKVWAITTVTTTWI